MDTKDINLENDLDETLGSDEEIKSGLKIRTNLKAGAITLSSRVASGPGESLTSGIAVAPQLNVNVLAGVAVK